MMKSNPSSFPVEDKRLHITVDEPNWSPAFQISSLNARFPESKKDQVYGFFNEKWDDFKTYLTDMAPIPIDIHLHRAILDVYSWVATCIYTWTFVKLFASLFIFNYIGGLATFFIVFIVFAGFVFYMFWSQNSLVENISLVILACCICDPFLVDYSNASRLMSFYAPPPLIVPMTFSLTIRLLGPNFAQRKRKYLLGTILTPATVFFLFFGLVTNSLSIAYIFWTIVLLSAAVIDLQLKIGHFRDGFGGKCIVYEQFSSIFWLISVNYVLMRLFCHKHSLHQNETKMYYHK